MPHSHSKSKRGERDTGYSKGLRHLEFCAALAATVNATWTTTTTSSSPLELVDFVNALNYTGEEVLPDCRVEHFNEAMQYLSFPQEQTTGITRQDIITAVQRCSLVHAAYEVVASSDHYEDLAELGLQDGGLEDLYAGGIHQDQSWIFRVRRYGQAAPTSNAKDKRYGEKARSMEMERRGLELLKPLLIQLGGKVDMRAPDCPIYVFDGLENTQKVLTRRIANGPKVSLTVLSSRGASWLVTFLLTPVCLLGTTTIDFRHQSKYPYMCHKYSVGTNRCLCLV